jgi:pimeloyl-ACP methyl ester carboxylesterase
MGSPVVTDAVPVHVTAFAGLYLLAIWLIEYDLGGPGGAVTRLPRTVISSHVLLAASGLGAWVGYLIADRDMLAWIALATLVAVELGDLTGSLASVVQPVLLLADPHDRLIPVGTTHQLAAVLPDARCSW